MESIPAKIAISGSSGFVGSNFMKTYPELEILPLKLRTHKIEELDLSGVSTIVHLAALVHQMKGAPPENYFTTNTELTIKLAKKAKKQGVAHFIFMSSVKVYGEYTLGEQSWNEKSACVPKDPYGESKLKAEKALMEMQSDAFKVSIIRTPLVYGPGVKANMYSLIELVERYSILPFGSINNGRSLVYVGNLSQLIQELIQRPKTGIFLASDAVPVSTSNLVAVIAESLNKEVRLVSIPSFLRRLIKWIKPSIHQRLFGNLRLDAAETRKNLNLAPAFTFEEGIKSMIDEYKQS